MVLQRRGYVRLPSPTLSRSAQSVQRGVWKKEKLNRYRLRQESTRDRTFSFRSVQQKGSQTSCMRLRCVPSAEGIGCQHGGTMPVTDHKLDVVGRDEPPNLPDGCPDERIMSAPELRVHTAAQLSEYRRMCLPDNPTTQSLQASNIL